MRIRLRLILMLAAVSISTPAGALVIVSFDPSAPSRELGTSFAIDIVADADAPLLGFGIDVSFDTGLLSLSNVAVGPSWTPVFTPDLDGLAGLAPPAGISGSGIVLATLTFEAIGLGTSPLVVSSSPGDLTEGFSLKTGGFDATQFGAGEVTVPEARNASLLLPACFGVLIKRAARRFRE